MDIWQEVFPVRFGSIDRSDRLTLATIFEFFQEAAINHAEHLGVGREALGKSGQVWILSRISVVVDRRPRWGETVSVRSWPRGAERLFAIRDYDIRDETGAAAVRGRSGWLVLDIEKRRPLRIQQIIEKLPQNEGIDALTGPVAGLDPRDTLVKAGERLAAYSDIDFNGHVNNTRYIQWIQDVLAAEILEQADRIRLDMNYLSEVRLGETVELWTASIPPENSEKSPIAEGTAAQNAAAGDGWETAIAIEGRKQDGPVCFRAELRTGKGTDL
jgi:acyl-ACP thioesterase